MPDPGAYDKKFLLLRISKAKEPTYGQEVKTYASVGEYWGSLREMNSQELQAMGAIESQATVEIRLRNLVDVGFEDRLQDKASGDVYAIDGINEGDNETIIRATR